MRIYLLGFSGLTFLEVRYIFPSTQCLSISILSNVGQPGDKTIIHYSSFPHPLTQAGLFQPSFARTF